jgi:putative transposase
MSATTKAPTSWREGRRLRAWELSQADWPVGKIAAALGVTHGAVSQWLARARKEGAEALHDRKRPGRVPRLTPDQQAKVPALLARGAQAWGFRGDRWTRERVGEVLRREFGVAYHPAHISRLLAGWGFSLQKPQRQAVQRNEAAIRAWRKQRLPAIEKRGRAKAARSCS